MTIKAAVGEGTVGGPLGELQAQYPDVKMGSYPQMGKDRVMTELVLRSSDEARLAEAAQRCAPWWPRRIGRRAFAGLPHD